MLQWFISNWGTISSALLGISEALHLLFPSDSGFGGFLGGLVKALMGIGAKPPGA